MAPPSIKLKLLFWLILGILSVALVEVPTGSQMFPFFTLWGIFFVVPLYLLHTLLLVSLVYLYGQPRFWTLYAAGMLFGMYEAYITKVLWTSFLPSGPPLQVAGLSIFETVVLVLIIHPIFAFIVPLFLGELMLTQSRDIACGLPMRVRSALQRRGVALLMALMITLGLMQFVNSPSARDSLRSGLGNSLVVACAVLIWRRTRGPHYTMRELLPTRKGLRVFGALLAFLYLLLGVAIKPKSIPGILNGQLIVWCLYGLLIWLFVRCLSRSRNELLPPWEGPLLEFSWKRFIQAAGAAIVVTSLGRMFLHDFGAIQMILFSAAYIIVGFFLLGGTVRYAKN